MTPPFLPFLQYSSQGRSIRKYEYELGGITQSTPMLPFSRWLQVFNLTWVVHVYSCPGPAFFCLPIDMALAWRLLPLPVALPLWFRSLVALFGPGSAGWDTVGRMGWFLPSSPRSDRSDTHTPDPPSLTVRLVRAFLRFWHFSPHLGSRNLFCVFPSTLSWLRAGSSISSGPLGACLRPRISRPPLWPLGWFWCGVWRHGEIGSIPGLVGGACSHCNCVFLLPDWVLLPGWVSSVGEGTRGGFWAVVVIVSLLLVLAMSRHV